MQKSILINLNQTDLETVLEKVVNKVLKSHQPNNTNAKPQVELITRQETAKLLGVSLPTLHDWTKNGLIPAHRIGTRVRYKRQEVMNSLNKVQNYQTKKEVSNDY